MYVYAYVRMHICMNHKDFPYILLKHLPPPRNSLAFSSRDGKASTRAEMSVHRPTATTEAMSSSHKGDTSKQATSCSTVVHLQKQVTLAPNF